MSIVVQDIRKNFGSQKALNGVSFKINKGEIVGFLGPNGAGKTTMMRILTTYSDPDGGTAQVTGLDTRSDSKEVRKKVGYLPENNPLYAGMYVREYLGFCAEAYGVSKERIETAIEQTSLGPEAHKKIEHLSKGYKQRVGLAAALIHDPEVLILDEPTTGLDPNQLVEIRKLIRKIGREKTILLSTHILKEVEAVCDRVLIINHGNLVADHKLSDLHIGQRQTIVVEFDYRVEEAFLLRLPKAQKVVNTSGFVYEISFDTDDDMRPVVFDFAHDNKLKTLQLSRKNKNLETLFSELTLG